MLKIGELAKICDISTQTLRYYDSIGLLSPERVDASSGYRYYSAKQVGLLNHIIKLKSLGFELSEIKSVLYASEEEKLSLYKRKTEALKKEADDRNENISQLKSLCQGRANTEDIMQHSFLRQIGKLSFEDDEQAVGKWLFKGRCKTLSKDMEKLCAEENLEKDTAYRDILFFLPGGAFYWMFAWSKGVLYRMLAEYGVLVPNEYKIVSVGEKTYMLINWIDDFCFTGNETSCQLVYEKLDSKRYTERETRAFCDNTDIPYVPDPEFEGTWVACAAVRNISDFFPDYVQDENRLYILGLKAFPRGICIKEMRGKQKELMLLYSKGVVINTADETAEHYIIKKYGEKTYLFLEHKSGDYSYGGRLSVYYVFKKEN